MTEKNFHETWHGTTVVSVRKNNEVHFWVVWDFIVDGELQKNRHDTCFPFSMS